MLTDKAFRDEVWKKYEYYSNEQNKEKFFEGNLYRRKKSFSDITRLVATFLIVSTLSVGIVYAGTIIYKNIWKNPTVIDYQEEQKVTEDDINNSITEEQAKEKANEILEKFGKEKDDITNVEFIKYPDEDKSYWRITTSKKYEIQIDTKEGNLVSYYDGTIDDTKIKATVEEGIARKIVMNLYNEVSNDKDYELKSIQKVAITDDSCLWQADFCKKYDGIYNDYQCIRITFIPETEQIKMINIFDEEFENNPIVITKDEAIENVKNKLQGEEIKNINCELKIEQMNPYVYMQDNPIEGNKAYKMNKIVRKVWSVECVINKNNIEQQEKYYVDVTTGEIIGGDSIK
ncbi:MAG TPA: hypothetical protein OIM60_07145 [Clostridiaceae bacterium]|nr:hypothetical protein [Clostridiaceae bacterium]